MPSPISVFYNLSRSWDTVFYIKVLLPFYMKILMVFFAIFYTISSQMLASASQKLKSKKLLPYKSLHNNRDIVYEKMC